MFYTFNWTSWKKWVAVLSLLLLFAITIQLSNDYIFENVTQDQTVNEGAITKSLKEEKEIALTFNVPWGDDIIVDVMNVLDEKQVKATFFVNGEWALRNEELAEWIVEENHELGLLGFSDKSYEGRSLDYIKEDIERGETVLKNLDYEPLQYVRVPENKYSELVTEQIHKLGYRTVFWSVYADVNKKQHAETISKQIASGTSSGDIIVMPIRDDLKKAPEVVEQIIEQKRSRGISICHSDRASFTCSNQHRANQLTKTEQTIKAMLIQKVPKRFTWGLLYLFAFLVFLLRIRWSSFLYIFSLIRHANFFTLFIRVTDNMVQSQ